MVHKRRGPIFLDIVGGSALNDVAEARIAGIEA